MAKAKTAKPGPNERARYIFLEEAVPKSTASHILGSVIPAACETKPFESYRPNWRDPDLKPGTEDRNSLETMMENLWLGEDPIELTEVLAGRRLAVSDDVNFKITELLKVFVNKKVNEDFEISAGTVKRYKFDNPGQNIDDLLLKCEPWRKQFEKLYNSDRSSHRVYYLVTGIATFSDVIVKWNQDAAKKYGGSAKAPGELANALTHGAPAIRGKTARQLDVGGDFKHHRTDGSNVYAKCDDEIIFALAYSEFTPEMEDEEPAMLSNVGPGGIRSPTVTFNDPRTSQNSSVANTAPLTRRGTGSAPKQPSFWRNLGRALIGRTNPAIASPEQTAVNINARPQSRDYKPRPPRKVLRAAYLGRTIRGYGFCAALGTEDDSSSEEEMYVDGKTTDVNADQNQPSSFEDAIDIFYVKEDENFILGGLKRMANGHVHEETTERANGHVIESGDRNIDEGPVPSPPRSPITAE